MDEIDVKILRCLKNNARENASVISEKVSMSVSQREIAKRYYWVCL